MLNILPIMLNSNLWNTFHHEFLKFNKLFVLETFKIHLIFRIDKIWIIFYPFINKLQNVSFANIYFRRFLINALLHIFLQLSYSIFSDSFWKWLARFKSLLLLRFIICLFKLLFLKRFLCFFHWIHLHIVIQMFGIPKLVKIIIIWIIIEIFRLIFINSNFFSQNVNLLINVHHLGYKILGRINKCLSWEIFKLKYFILNGCPIITQFICDLGQLMILKAK